MACSPLDCHDISVGATLKSLPIKSKEARPYFPYNPHQALKGPAEDVLCCSKLNYCPAAPAGTCPAPIPTACNVDCTMPPFSDGDAYLVDNYSQQVGEYCHVWVSNELVVATWQVRD